MSMVVPEFTSAAELRAHYAALRKRTGAVRRVEPRKPETVTIEVPRPLVRYKIKADVTREVSVFEITKAVSAVTGVSIEEMLGEGRIQKIKVPRYAIIYMARILTSHSLTRIGDLVDRDHTTVLHALRKVGQNWQDYQGVVSDAYGVLLSRFPVKAVYGPVNNRHHLFNQYTDSVMVSA